MKNSSNYAAKFAGIASLGLLLTTSAFADYRHQDQTDRRDSNRDRGRIESNRGGDNFNYRENDRVNLQGKITSFNRENNGYRMNLDRGPSFFVPETYFRNRARDLRVGVSISLGGIFRRGAVYVDAVSWPDDGYGYDGYDRSDRSYGGHLFGVVDRVDFRRGTVWLRDDRSGRLIEVDLRRDRYSRLNVDDLRRGDFVELSGNWIRGGIFAADRIDSVRSGRGGRGGRGERY
jgi:hypothetical protein